jgi:soluble lytic murein transglycosylase-like protein
VAATSVPTPATSPSPSARLFRNYLARYFTEEAAERGWASEGSAVPGLGVRLLSFLSPCEADAAEGTDAALMPQLQDVANRLHRLVVTEANADSYRGDVGRLLNLTAERQISKGTVDAGEAQTYLTLVLSTAWQESCWRQFVIDGEHIRWLESSTGDIGLMQVNKHVWRGFYNIDRLKWDVLYNAGAGCEILARMMHYASEASSKFGPVPIGGHLARSAYAAYNGGPGACNRWRRHEPPALKQIDSSFWQKYRAVEDGAQIDILSCARSWGH